MKKFILKTHISFYYRLVILLLTGTMNFSIFAETPNPTGAKQFAEDFFKTNAPRFAPGKVYQKPVLRQCYQSASYKATPVFVFQNTEKGFVVVAQNNNQFAVAGYAPEGQFQADSVPPQLSSLLQFYEDSLQIKPAAIQKASAGEPVMTPLLDEAGISLNQFNHEEVGGCPTGCVATAFVQIMAYYKYPTTGVGSHCYTHSTYGQLCADFENTTYNWNNPTNEDYKKISFHVGIAMDMDYCGSNNGSAPSGFDYEKAMSDYFRYYLNNGFTDSYFIINEIHYRRPVYAELPGEPGHAVVLDGYDTDGLFHINFGWGGQYNGYYVLNNNSTFTVAYKFGTNISSTCYITPYPLKTDTQDSLALVTLNNSLKNSTGWNLKQPVSTWKGVVTLNGRVISLKLNNGSYLTYSGTIPSEIGDLTALQRLDLLGKFDGELPSTIANLTELKMLIIYAGQGTLKAQLPENIDNLTNLEILAIPQHTEGNIPHSIGNLTKLTRLILNSGNLTGNIPNEIGNLKNLTYLNLKGNKLTGSIPTGISNLTQLTEIYLGENQLSGPLPDNIGNLTELVALTLSDNQLSGNLPESLGNCNKLKILHLYNNQFTGEIPASLGNLSLIKNLDFSHNQFTSLPDEMGNWNNLEELNLNNNQLTSLPASINNLANLTTLYAKHNQIAELPENFGAFPTLSDINLSYNNLKEFPEGLCLLSKLQSISIRNNKIEKFPASITMLPPTLNYLALDSNEIKGAIPRTLLENGNLSALLLDYNRFTFEDLPVSNQLKNRIGNQKPVMLSKKVFKTAIGDTLHIDIRKIAPFTLSTNEYHWILASNNKAVGTTPDPILTVIIDEKTIQNKYYCKVTNPSAPTYTFIFSGSSLIFPCLDFVTTDTISFQLATEEELIAEKYKNSYVVSSNNVPSKIVEDKIVTLVPPLKVRGAIKWQASSDGTTWFDLSENMSQNDLKANFVSVKQQELVLSPKTPAYYRCSVQDINCEPLLSDTIQVNPFGQVLYDENVNVETQSKTVKIDSIEVTIPAKIYDKDFRLTIVKLDNQPPAPDSIQIMPAYDVTVSFAETFEVPLLIKLKNIDKKTFDSCYIHNYKAVYLDKETHEWIPYEKSYISLQDTSMVFETNHLTFIAVSFYIWTSGYDRGYERNNISVYYKDKETGFMQSIYDKKQTPQPWHKAWPPLLVQDVTEYLNEVREKFLLLGFSIPEKFNVYIKQMEDADGIVGISGMINNYLTIHTFTENPIALRSLLAHEYMHYTQSGFISPDPGNIFWMEANAHLTDRMVWDENEIPVSESEKYLLDGRKAENSIYNFLSNSWDYWDKGFYTQNLFGNVNYCYLAGTFLHYMRSYSKAETKLDPATLLKQTTQMSGDTWLTYLSNYVAFSMNSNIGDEYDDYVRYILSGENKKFTILSSEGNPYSYLIKNSGTENKGTFASRLIYNFAKEDNNPQTDKFEITVPYLASQVLLLYNQAPDRGVVVNYKRLHDEDKDYKVYYAKYDFQTQQTTFVDISDSTKYNFFIEARTDESVKETQNICFLLLVNKKCSTSPSSGDNFNASFELTATPVYDIENLYTGWIAGKNGTDLNVVNFSPGHWSFILPGVRIRPYSVSYGNLIYHNINYYSSDRSELTDSTYVVNVHFSEEERMEYPDDDPFDASTTYPSIYNRDVTQRIEYNFVRGEIKIHCNAHTINKYEYKIKKNENDDNDENYITVIATSSHWDDNATLWVKNLYSMATLIDAYGVAFSTRNSAETQAAIEKISYSHLNTDYKIINKETGESEPDPDNTYMYNYVSTDYSSGDVILKLIFDTR
ncbi:MAG: C10 family peptidase [Paludibacteraceae bacterium]|nr:C10 family peptidase [Paludibacteraceae bacterium]